MPPVVRVVIHAHTPGPHTTELHELLVAARDSPRRHADTNSYLDRMVTSPRKVYVHGQ